jgi:glutathione S-transferase
VDLKNKPQDLLAINPYGKVPVLVDGDGVIYESAIINEYLEEKYPQIPLLPKDPLLKARARIWIDFSNTRVQDAASRISHNREPEKARERLQHHLETLDRELAQREYLAGDYSLADITYVPFLVRRERYGAAIDRDWLHLKDWMERLLARPAVQGTIPPPA